MRKQISKAFNGQANNLKGVRISWTKENKDKLASLWEWGTYETLMSEFKGIGLEHEFKK